MAGKLNYACIGAGSIADKKHLKQYSELDNVELTSICDVDLKAAHAGYECRRSHVTSQAKEQKRQEADGGIE